MIFFFTILVSEFCHNFSFWVLSQLKLTRTVTIWFFLVFCIEILIFSSSQICNYRVLSDFHFCQILSSDKFEFFGFVTFWIFQFCHILSFWVLTHFELLSFVTFWGLSHSEFCHNLSFLTFWVLVFCHVLSFWVLLNFDFLSFVTCWLFWCKNKMWKKFFFVIFVCVGEKKFLDEREKNCIISLLVKTVF